MVRKHILLLFIFFCSFSDISGSEKKMKESGEITGILIAKEDDCITVIPDKINDDLRFYPVWNGGTKSEGGGYDKKTIEAIKGLFVFNKVKLKYKFIEKYRVINVEMIIPEKKSGRAAGKITAKGEHWIEITTKDGRERYMPRWINNSPQEGGHLDGKILNEIQLLFVGEEIEFNWEYDERKRITEIELESDSFPLILRGFSGMVKGEVVSKQDNNLILLKVEKLLKIWKNNSSEEPWTLEGMTVKIGPNWHKVNGKWQPYERHTAFIKSLKAGEKINLEIKYGERDVMLILELSEEQRKRAASLK